MNTKFNESLERFYQAIDDTEKSEIYDAMEKYAYSSRRDYSCYDADMYVSLYKCAKTSEQRNRALNHIQDTIDEDAFQYHDELIENLRQFVSIKDSLKEEDEKKFDTICMKAFDFFDKQLQSSYDQAMCDRAYHISDDQLAVAERELREVAEIIVSTGMQNLESYRMALSVFGS